MAGEVEIGGQQGAANREDDPGFTIVHGSGGKVLRVGRAAVAGAGMFPGLRITGRRDGVITTATPWMTAENPANSIP